MTCNLHFHSEGRLTGYVISMLEFLVVRNALLSFWLP